MSQEAERYKVEFIGRAQGVAIGDGNIIYNYFYTQETKPVDTDNDDGADLPCPYRGLFHFGPNDAEYFFGRDVFVDELYRATQTRGLIPVLGASGSGKSSVVLAGLVPKLQKAGHWQFVHFRPGEEKDPFLALASALVPLSAPNLKMSISRKIEESERLATAIRAGNLGRILADIRRQFSQDRILLIADQFEELYTICPETATRQQFLDQLIAEFAATPSSSGKPVLVLTMRADFLGNALAYPPFADQLRQVDIKIRSMNLDELTEVIEQPATQLGVTFEGGLVERILDDVADQPGNLPLLEFALTELWQQRQGKQLTHAVYEAIGQVEGALARHADEKYSQLNEAEKGQVKRIFEQLVRPGEGAEDTRRIAMKSELGDESWALVQQLADARLVVTSRNATEQETVEVVHEALIRNWSELRGWMETDRVFRAWQERLRSAMRQWEATNRDAGSLLRGAALAEATELLAERPDDLVAEREFIEQSYQESQRLKRQRRQSVIAFWGLTLGLLVAGAVGVGLFWNFRTQKRQADLNRANSTARSALTRLTTGKDLDATVDAVQAGQLLQRYNISDPEIMSALLTSAYDGQERNRLEGFNTSISSMGYSPERHLIALTGLDGRVELWKSSGEQWKVLEPHDGLVYSTSFSSDSNLLATGSEDGTAKVWRLDNAGNVSHFHTFEHDAAVKRVEFSPDGSRLLTISENRARLWDVPQKTELVPVDSSAIPILNPSSISCRIEGSEQTIVASYPEKQSGGSSLSENSDTVQIQKIRTQEQAAILVDQDNQVWAINFDSLEFRQVESVQDIQPINLPGNNDNAQIISVNFSPDCKTIITGSADHVVRFWDIETGEQQQSFTAHDAEITDMVSMSSSQTLLTSSGDRTVRFWDFEAGESISISSTVPYKGGFSSISLSENGNFFSTISIQTRMLQLWNVENQSEITAPFSGMVSNAIISPDGSIIAINSLGEEEVFLLQDLDRQRLIEMPSNHNKEWKFHGFSPDSQTLIFVESGIVRLWDRVTNEVQELAVTIEPDAYVFPVSLSPDNKYVAITVSTRDYGNESMTTTVWDVETGKEYFTLPDSDFSNYRRDRVFTPRIEEGYGGLNNDAKNYMEFSPDGTKLAIINNDNWTVELWDVETQALLPIFFVGHDEILNSVRFSPDGNMLVTTSLDQTVKFWDVATRKELWTLEDYPGRGSILGLSPGGQTLATQITNETGETIIKLWHFNLSLEGLVEVNCDRIRNYLMHSPDISEDDPKLCDGIGTEVEE